MKDIGLLEKFVSVIEQQDTHKRLKIAEEIISYVNDPDNSLEFPGVDRMIDGLLAWAGNSNFKVSQYGLEILASLAERLTGNFRNSLNSVIPVIVDRLGDSKSQVRDQAHNVLMKLMDPVSNPQAIFELLNPKFSHKNWRVREELMICLVKTIRRFGASSLVISKQMPAICKLLSDPTSKVRDAAVNTIVEVYRHVGEKVRSDLGRRGIPAARLATIFTKFDECLESGNMVIDSYGVGGGEFNGDLEREKPKAPQGLKGSVRRSNSFASQPKKASIMDRGSNSSGGGSSGAVDECDFVSQWEESVDLRVYSIKDATEELSKINNILSNPNNDWEQRVSALKRLRELVKQYGDHEQLPKLLRDLENSLRISVKDLRSQVVKEACLALSLFASRLQRDFDFLAEVLTPPLITLIPNSVKVMASSGNACLRLIIKHTHNPKLIPIFVSNLLTNKSKEIRRRSGEYLDLLLETWETSSLKGQVALIEEAIRKGISDADSEARAAVRRAYWHFAQHYKSRADSLMDSFESSKQKLLQSDRNLLQAGLTRPASTTGSYRSKPLRNQRTTSASSASDVEDRAVMPPPRNPAPRETQRYPMGMQRSASQLDGRNLMKAPKMEPRQKSCDDFIRNSKGRHSVQKPARRQMVTSQPSSRSNSPVRRMPSFSRERSEDYMKRISPMRTRIPTPRKASTSHSSSRPNSRTGSRDSSPIRAGRGMGNAVFVGDMRGRYNGNQGGRNVTEDELWDAYERSSRRRFDSGSHHNQHSSDEDSEGSSLSSERSGNALASKGPTTQDVNEIIRLLSSQSWTDNKDGMTSLQYFLQGSRKLSLEETLRIKEVCNKYFADPHIKVYRIFLDVLSEFIIQCRVNLNDWLFVLLTRLLHKIGSDILPSLHSKVAKVLDIVRDSFPYDQQFQILTKYIIDNTQTPTLKMKVAILHYLQGLIKQMDSSDFSNTGSTRLAVSKIITWTSEPKSAEVRKEAAAVIVALFELNTPVFSTLLAVLPNSFQDGATKLLHSHLRPVGGRVQATPKAPPEYNVEYEDYSSRYASPPRKGQAMLGYRSISPNKPQFAGYDVVDSGGSYDSAYSEPKHFGGRPEVRDGAEADAVRSKLSFGGGDPTERRDEASYQATNEQFETPLGRYNNDCPPNDSQSPYQRTLGPTSYNPMQYQDKDALINNDKSPFSPEMIRVADGAEAPDSATEPTTPAGIDIMNEIIIVLSASRNASGSEDIKSALLELIKLARMSDRQCVVKIKSLLPNILETLKHPEGAIRCLAARALREIIRSLPEAYKNDLKSVIASLVHTQADPSKEVSKTAEECCALIAGSQPAKDVFTVLCPLVEGGELPANLAAIKMIHTLVEQSQASSVVPHLPNVVAALLTGYDHSESTVRKASVFCLVAIHNLVGENVLSQYLRDLSGTKMKLLNLYIKRSQSSQ